MRTRAWVYRRLRTRAPCGGLLWCVSTAAGAGCDVGWRCGRAACKVIMFTGVGSVAVAWA
jgi:hypothetical protein